MIGGGLAAHWRHACALGAVVLMLTGCSNLPRLDDDRWARLPATVALDTVPWYPPDPYQCGPQSLAAVLDHAGVPVEPNALIDDIYVPARQGSFAAEVTAAARKHGRLPWRLDPTLDALLTAIADGYPVMIMQNVGLGFAPVWHFAVVVGFDRDENSFILRSGKHHELYMNTVRFHRRWRLADYWAIVLLSPEALPPWVERGRFEAQLSAMPASWDPHLPALYRRMLERWPDSTMARLGLGNLAFEQRHLEKARQHYQHILVRDPGHIAALNNLAEVEAASGDLRAAIDLACRAAELSSGHPLEPLVQRTLRSLRTTDQAQPLQPACNPE